MDWIQAKPEDAIELAEIRAAAMRPSLEELGRYDAQRVRKRFLDTYVAAETFKILHQGTLAGLFVLRNKVDHLYLDHLYVLAEYQNLRLGKAVIEHITGKAKALQLPVKLGALRGSPANAFYVKHGFIQTHEDEFDIYYELRV
ncbi:GNAT family N-acetyltransferase [Rouxiella sp. S1S-2]|uniref:GNAT family N-acetyltransferase n=1 Tax=Rouxiella sp. S1S-2 TaxID=2653856 RepID=UPI001263F768|nr:GNAT family N-acetyltransferase [Rouxiella sp. S1S-2]KAB7896774.1 GNAT family N-acetyltransferase [Rouxiella sp. S1S-2]